MQMTKGKAITLLAFSLWPVFYMFLFMALVFFFIATTMMQPGGGGEPPMLFLIIFPLHFVTIFDIFVLIAIYLYHLFKTDAVPQDKKALWAVVLFLGNMIAMPVFWYLYIWKPVKENPVFP